MKRYGLDHVGPRWSAPKLAAWRQATHLEHEIGLAAATWNDYPHDLPNALIEHRWAERCEPAGQLDLWDDDGRVQSRHVTVKTGAYL